MTVSRLPRRHPTSRPTAPSSVDAAFPRAVRGEDYSRYAAAMWGQGVRWLRGEVAAAAAAQNVIPDVYTVLHAAAVACVERNLYPQEEQLLSELIQREWDAIAEDRGRGSPEIPAFLRRPN
jgi:hypothetical protein